MADHSALPPELASVLATLAQFAPPASASANTHQSQTNWATAYNADQNASNFALNGSGQTHPEPERTLDPRLRPQRRPTPISRPTTPGSKAVIDPATITDWREGLRCVTKIAAQNANFAATIKRMMSDQRKHELEWFSSRQALKQSQAARVAEAAKARQILSDLGSGAMYAGVESQQSEEQKLAELGAFDAKLYRAQMDMNEAMTVELKALGVPFFGTSAELVVDGNESDADGNRGERPKWARRVGRRELFELQGKMVAHLEDLYGE